MVRAHKRRSLIYFLSLFLFDSQYRSAKYLAYDNYVPNFLSGRIYSKLFLFAFYHPTSFIFRGSFHYFLRDGIFFLILFHDYDRGFQPDLHPRPFLVGPTWWFSIMISFFFQFSRRIYINSNYLLNPFFQGFNYSKIF